MERATLSFSIPNLITVWIMLAIGFFALALLTQGVQKWKGGSVNPLNSDRVTA